MTGKEEVQVLLNEGMPYVEQLLGTHGEFVPFGAALDADGEISLVTTEAEDENAELHVESLVTSFRSGASEGRVTAMAIFVNVEVSGEPDEQPMLAVQVALEHSDGYSADIFIPYELDGHAVTFGELTAKHREGAVFAGPSAGGGTS